MTQNEDVRGEPLWKVWGLQTSKNECLNKIKETMALADLLSEIQIKDNTLQEDTFFIITNMIFTRLKEIEEGIE